MKQKKRVAAIITEYWDICHADVVITKMLEGFQLDGRHYDSTLDIVSMYVEKFPENDMSRDLAAKHGLNMYGTMRETLLCGGTDFDLDGILIIGEHGDYPDNELGQTLYPRRIMFEECLNVMLEFNKIVPVYSDKGFAVIQEDIEWMYEKINQHNIPFMSSSVIPYAFPYPEHRPFPTGAPLHKMFGFAFGALERYTYHALEMMQSVAENRAYGESGISKVRAYKGKEAIDRMLSEDWEYMYRKLGGFVNLINVNKFPHDLPDPVFFELDYYDGLKSGILYIDNLEVRRFVATYQVMPDEEPICHEYRIQDQKPYIHFGKLDLEIERFIHTGRSPHALERSMLTTGAMDALMQAYHYEKEIETPHLNVQY
ncbi:hypothetical protein [Paenibacillus eucommiae]|uniref:Uncharacterized protein n=1 Tax=Paenibacillus eucommiae TaxID=1355755 RepID=A0ABS4J7R3_9BACL|nr:hypothetical protein [Paenibacillus eucommiae]MBP1995867.1 hypothetical protein [Paenibacillus eucommiae]